MTDFNETLKVIDHLDEYRALKAFCEWVTREHPEVFADPDTAADTLHRLTLEHMGIDPTTFQKQSRALMGLLDFMKEMP